ncbi:YdaU family protein [Bartonella bovis]|uniref:Phage related protein n=1 Tax=Bartonella bovis 91-4 TaxID=1094491 RepID=N6UJ21_9HYPH|nr:DUF1376 domain-containing protein [Bartonella bovis]ENN90248.1 phage related protein [Bartonella bovis 91-4]
MKQAEQSEFPNYEASTLPYVCWYQNDFLGGVRGMRAHEIGIYTILLNEIYARGRPLDLSPERLARLCGCDKRTFISVLEMLITEGKILNLTCGLWNKRCENVFRERAQLLEQKSFAGHSSAQKRKKINAKIQHLLNTCPTDDELNSKAQNEEKETPNGVSQKTGAFSDTPPHSSTHSSTTTSLKGHRLPANWVGDIHAAISEGLSEEQARWQEKKFRDYWHAKSGQQALKVDWSATWRNWYRREIERLKENQEKLCALSSGSNTVSCNTQEETLYRNLINYQAT